MVTIKETIFIEHSIRVFQWDYPICFRDIRLKGIFS